MYESVARAPSLHSHECDTHLIRTRDMRYAIDCESLGIHSNYCIINVMPLCVCVSIDINRRYIFDSIILENENQFQFFLKKMSISFKLLSILF